MKGSGEGFQLIGNALGEGWDDREPVTPLNCPKTYISSACQQTIYALRTCPLKLGEKDACKDPVDCTKMALKLGLYHVAAGGMRSEGGGGY